MTQGFPYSRVSLRARQGKVIDALLPPMPFHLRLRHHTNLLTRRAAPYFTLRINNPGIFRIELLAGIWRTSRKVEDEVKAEKKRVRSTLHLDLDLSLLQMLRTAVRHCNANTIPGRLAMETGGIWGMTAACPTPRVGHSYSVVRFPPPSRGVSLLAEQDAEKVRQRTKIVIWSVLFISFVWLNQTNQMNQINQIN